MEEPKYRFVSFRIADQGDEHLPDDAPPSAICKALEDVDVPYEMVVSRLERSDAWEDEDTKDLYPRGPSSGPDFVMLYEFITTEDNIRRASATIESVYCTVPDESD